MKSLATLIIILWINTGYSQELKISYKKDCKCWAIEAPYEIDKIEFAKVSPFAKSRDQYKPLEAIKLNKTRYNIPDKYIKENTRVTIVIGLWFMVYDIGKMI